MGNGLELRTHYQSLEIRCFVRGTRASLPFTLISGYLGPGETKNTVFESAAASVHTWWCAPSSCIPGTFECWFGWGEDSPPASPKFPVSDCLLHSIETRGNCYRLLQISPVIGVRHKPVGAISIPAGAESGVPTWFDAGAQRLNDSRIHTYARFLNAPHRTLAMGALRLSQ